MLLLSMMNQRPSRNVEDGDLTWMAPKFNERVMAGQDYFAKWNATSLPTDPMFQLCTSTAGPTYIGNTKYDDCGDAVAAPVQEDAGVYFASLIIPNITSSNPFVVKIHDAAGFVTQSPLFFVDLPAIGNSSSADTPGPTSDNPATTQPQSSSVSPSSPGISIQFQEPPKADSFTGNQPLIIPMSGPSLALPASSVIPSPTAPSLSSLFTHAPSWASPLDKRSALNSSSPAPAPMYATLAVIPLILVSAGLAISIFVWFRQKRTKQLKRLYLTDHPVLHPRRPVAKTLSSSEDLELAVQGLEQERMFPSQALGVAEGFAERAARRMSERALGTYDERYRGLRIDHVWRVEPQGRLIEQQQGNSPSQRVSYAPEPRSLVSSYFSERVTLESDSAEYMNGHIPQEKVLIQPPDIMGGIEDVPKPPLVTTKLSERLHMRTRLYSDSDLT